MPNLFHTKSLHDLQASAERPEQALRRCLGATQVTLLGIGAIVGAGIFATIGTAAAGDAARPGAGPSLILSFAITATVCSFTALCYAEFAAMVPVAGSAYTYSYATLGELVAWIIGWDLIIEYAIGNVAVAISWANYFRSLLDGFGIHVPLWLATDFRTAAQIPGLYASAPHCFGIPIVVNVLAAAIVAVITVVLVWGVRESASLNASMVVVKIAVLLFFVAAALSYVSPVEMARNWRPFQPNGWHGTMAGAAVVFFAYIGFDAVSTVAEETRNPGRDLPIGILTSLLVCTVLYMIVAAVFTGMVPYPELTQALATQQAEPLTLALAHVAPTARWPALIVAAGSVVAHTAVLLVFQLGQPRIFFSMARDGLLPPAFARVHPRYRTPHVTTILTGIAVGGVAAVASIDEMVDLTNIGTLFAFALVCTGIPILRWREPERLRPFRVPFGAWFLPSLGVLSCVGLMAYLPPTSWWRFVGWLLLGLGIYAGYGYTRSVVGRGLGRPERTPLRLKLASASFFALAVALLVLPHHAGMKGLVATAAASEAPHHARAALGIVLATIGTVGLVLAWGARRDRGRPS